MGIDPPEECSAHPSANAIDEASLSKYYTVTDGTAYSLEDNLSVAASSIAEHNLATALVVRDQDPPSTNESEHQLVKWVEQSDDDFSDALSSSESDNLSEVEEEDDAKEHYRKEYENERQLVVLEKDTSERNDQIVVADTKNQLAFIPPPKYNGYQHCFITVPDEHRFLMLYTFLKRNVKNKVIIYFSTTKTTQFYAKLLTRLKFDVRVIHNGQKKEQFLETFFEFSRQKSGIMCLPDFQGTEFAIPPTVRWIVQFEPPGDPNDYIFRVGRVSSEVEHASGRALLFLTPRQFGFLQYYKAARVKIYEYTVPKIANVQKNYEKLIRNDKRLRKLSREAYNAFLMSYASHEYREIFNVHELDKELVALAFGLPRSPPIENEEEEEEEVARKKTRDRPTWKPAKKEKDGWLRGAEKSWRYADRHADIMKLNPKPKRPGDYKPTTIHIR